MSVTQPRTEPTTAPRCLVVGAGLIGTSIALALHAAGWELSFQDSDPLREREARDRLETTQGEPPSSLGVDLVVVAVPPSHVAAQVIRCLSEYPAATITDVCSVKAPIIQTVQSHPGAGRYVPSHPMAGSHLNGPANARGDLFAGRSWAVSNTCSSTALLDVLRLVDLCGASPVIVEAETHDRAVARVSHLPHLISGMLAEHLAGSPPVFRQLIGRGALDMTRIAQGDADLWRQILGANSVALRAEVESFIRLLQRVVDPGEEEYTASLGGLLEVTMSSALSLHRPRALSLCTLAIKSPQPASEAIAGVLALLGRGSAELRRLTVTLDSISRCRLEITVATESVAGFLSQLQGHGWSEVVLVETRSGPPPAVA